jgi:SAM-dependent methyltransferase
MHGSVLGFFAYGALQTREVEGRDVLEVGALDVNGTVRPMVEARRPASYVAVDVVDGPGVDRVCDATDLIGSFGMDAFDVVISIEMLEHADDWQAAILSMVAVLRPGGVLVWTTRSPGFAFHHPPDRWRYTQEAMAEVLDRLGLEPLVLADDPEFPGVFVKARKPAGWTWATEYPLSWKPADRDPLAGIEGVTPMREPRRLLCLPGHVDGTSYYRCWQPWTALARYSGDLAVIPPPGQHTDRLPDEDEASEFDLITRQRVAGPGPELHWRRWNGRTTLVYELDDNIFQPDPAALPNWLNTDLRDSAIRCLEMADGVTVSTQPLAEVVRPHNPNVAVVPNHIHEDLLKIQRPRRDRVTICYEASTTHLLDVCMVQGPLGGVLDEHPDADFHAMGTDYRPLVGGRGRFTPWQPNVWDFYASIDGDIAIAPLADTPMNRCRSAIKALTFNALGIPVVASDIEPYRDFIIDGVTGFLCRTHGEWHARLGELINDPAARDEMGAKAKAVAADWTIQGNWQRWADAYQELAGWPTTGGTA